MNPDYQAGSQPDRIDDDSAQVLRIMQSNKEEISDKKVGYLNSSSTTIQLGGNNSDFSTFPAASGARPPQNASDSEVLHRRPVYKLTIELVSTYKQSNPDFLYNKEKNPKRVLTKPMQGLKNNGYDNSENDYILYVNDVLDMKWQVLDLLGCGTFGQVVKCRNVKTGELAAVKVIKNKPAYYNQSVMEVSILQYLSKNYPDLDNRHIIKLIDTFTFRNHLCLVFEVLSVNLYELIKQNHFRGLSLKLVKTFLTQILDALSVLHDCRVIHCDLKPENILLQSINSPSIKVIDFGSACLEQATVYTYIQSRFYRSPEILLGLNYSTAIDIWSLGCIAVELFLGLPLFPGTSEYNQITRICDLLGLPPVYLLEFGKSTPMFFNRIETADKRSIWTLKPLEQFNAENKTNEKPSKRYFSAKSLNELIINYPISTKLTTKNDIEKEMKLREYFLDFISGLLKINPVERWSPDQAKLHPFITGQPLVGPFIPAMELKTQHEHKERAAFGQYLQEKQAAAMRKRASTLVVNNLSGIPSQIQEVVNVNSRMMDSRYPTHHRVQGSLSEIYDTETSNAHITALSTVSNNGIQSRSSPKTRSSPHIRLSNSDTYSKQGISKGEIIKINPALKSADLENSLARKTRSLSVSDHGGNPSYWFRSMGMKSAGLPNSGNTTYFRDQINNYEKYPSSSHQVVDEGSLSLSNTSLYQIVENEALTGSSSSNNHFSHSHRNVSKPESSHGRPRGFSHRGAPRLDRMYSDTVIESDDRLNARTNFHEHAEIKQVRSLEHVYSDQIKRTPSLSSGDSMNTNPVSPVGSGAAAHEIKNRQYRSATSRSKSGSSLKNSYNQSNHSKPPLTLNTNVAQQRYPIPSPLSMNASPTTPNISTSGHRYYQQSTVKQQEIQDDSPKYQRQDISRRKLSSRRHSQI